MVSTQHERQRDRLLRIGIDTGQTQGLSVLLESLELSDLDLMTIRDLVKYGPDRDDGCLIGMLGLMFSALGEGSLCVCLDRDSLQESILKSTDPAVTELADGFIRHLDKGLYDALVDRTGSGDFKPLVLDDSSGRRLLYFQKFYYHERRLKQRLISFLSLSGGRELSGETISRLSSTGFSA
jgi:exodeoxyribonuclease V alpha subunit